MFKNTLWTLFCLTSTLLLNAQSNSDTNIPEATMIESTNEIPTEYFNYKDIKVFGTVIDGDTKIPLEYATVSFYSHDEQKIIDGVITNIKG